MQVTLFSLIGFVGTALLLRSTGLLRSDLLLVLSILAGVWPLVHDILKSLRQKRVDLGLPVVATIFILLFLKRTEAAGVFVLLVLVGRLFKEIILWRVRESVAAISRDLPDQAFVKKDGEILELKITDIQKGDTVVVKAGGRVPVDGILLSESAPMDESVITGEAKPVSRKKGQRIVAASIHLGDYAEIEAADTSANSTIAQMHRLVEEAQGRNAPLSRFTTRYAEITSIVAFLAVVIVYFSTGNIEQALALWIALVPVIFALIVPVATTIGISHLARSGVLVKTAEALENLTQVDTLCFDKTGTLTRGEPEISGILTAGGMAEKELIQIAGSVERMSEHSLGKPIVEEATHRGLSWLPAEEIKIIEGRGIAASLEGRRVLIGNKEFLRENQVPVPSEIEVETLRREEEGATPIFVARNNELGGVIFLSDQPRAESRPTLSRLRRFGFSLVMLTGDQPEVAEKIGETVGVTEIKARLLPDQKIKAIQELKENGRTVLMVGDGINDAPALAEANVGIAMGLRGVGITLESAQVVLVHDTLSALPRVFFVAKNTFRIIRMDLVLSTTIHLLTALLVLFGYVGILGSTIFHQVSSVLVLLNTARLFSNHAGRA